MKLKKMVVALSLALALPAVAQAAEYTIEDPTSFVGSALTPAGTFQDLWKFSLGSTSFAGGDISNFKVRGYPIATADITGLAATLLQWNSASSSWKPLFALSGQSAYSWEEVLGKGQYQFEITGTGVGKNGGYYNFGMFAAAVPEPETYALFLAGLGVMGAVARRRMKR